MAEPPRPKRCGHCGRQLPLASGPGRRRDYCDDTCRRKAQRIRDRQRLSAAPSQATRYAKGIADDLCAAAAQLRAAETAEVPLSVKFEYASRLQEDITCYTAAAVHDARTAGLDWAQIAVDGDRPQASARASWSAMKVTRLLENRGRRAPAPAAVPSGPQVPEQRTAPDTEFRSPFAASGMLVRPGALGIALATLWKRADVRLLEIARRSGMATSTVLRVLEGEHVPTWAETHMLATILGGEAEELRLVWEAVSGVSPRSRLSPAEAARRLHVALRGLHLAAAAPPVEELCRGTRLEPDVIAAVLDGSVVPDWATVKEFAAQLSVDPAAIRPAWEELDYARLAAGRTSAEVKPS